MKMLPDIAVNKDVQDVIRDAIEEDLGSGDATTLALVPKSSVSTAVIISRGKCVVAGTDVAKAVFGIVDRRIKCRILVEDGQPAKPGQPIMRLTGPTRGILTAERTALNFLQRMCGIATLARTFVDKVRKHKVVILDTRKTTPLLRVFEKYAVLCGGGRNHRMGLYDMILIKDNHRALWGGGLNKAITEARKKYPRLAIEVEVENSSELEDALKASPEWILLDNMKPTEMRRCVRLCRKRALLEASGGITIENVVEVAKTGVDAISLGCLTHSAPAVDLSLEILRNE